MNGGRAEWGSGGNEEGEKEQKVTVEEDGKPGHRWDVFQQQHCVKGAKWIFSEESYRFVHSPINSQFSALKKYLAPDVTFFLLCYCSREVRFL